MNPEHLSPSEFILNDDGSIYHLGLKPGEIAETIITVGDPDRVASVTKHFETIEVDKHRREFKTQTGTYKGKRLTVISTGIGTDNIDIVFNELDALVNIDFETRTINKELTIINFIRIGTSGAIQPDIEIDSFLVSEMAVGFDNLLHFYGNTEFLNLDFSEAIVSALQLKNEQSTPYVVGCDENLLNVFQKDKDFKKGITITNVGFYGPQSRKLRLALRDPLLPNKLQNFEYRKNSKIHRITNLEMETSGIYGMAKLLGHRAISLNAILANRPDGTFSKNPQKTIDKLIEKTLEILTY